MSFEYFNTASHSIIQCSIARVAWWSEEGLPDPSFRIASLALTNPYNTLKHMHDSFILAIAMHIAISMSMAIAIASRQARARSRASNKYLN